MLSKQQKTMLIKYLTSKFMNLKIKAYSQAHPKQSREDVMMYVSMNLEKFVITKREKHSILNLIKRLNEDTQTKH